MTDETSISSQNLADYVAYQAQLAPLIAEMVRTVDIDEVIAEFTLDGASAPKHQLDYAIGMAERFKDIGVFMFESAEKIPR